MKVLEKLNKTTKEQEECDHGVFFDEEEAKAILASVPPRKNVNAAVDFIMGPTGSSAVRKRFPRLNVIIQFIIELNRLHYITQNGHLRRAG